MLAVNRSWVIFESKVGIFHWDLLDAFYLILLFSYFHIFLLCLFYLSDYLHLVETHQVDLIDLHLILCFPIFNFCKMFQIIFTKISVALWSIKLMSWLFLMSCNDLLQNHWGIVNPITVFQKKWKIFHTISFLYISAWLCW